MAVGQVLKPPTEAVANKKNGRKVMGLAKKESPSDQSHDTGRGIRNASC